MITLKRPPNVPPRKKRLKQWHWSSVEFGARSKYPIVWVHPSGDGEGVPLRFDSLAELKELVNTLQGAINAMERTKGPRKR